MTSTQKEATKKTEGIRINRSVYQEANCKLKLLSERFWGTFKRSHKYWKNYERKFENFSMLKALLLKNLQSVWFFHERKAALQLSHLCFFQVADPKFKLDFLFQFFFSWNIFTIYLGNFCIIF